MLVALLKESLPLCHRSHLVLHAVFSMIACGLPLNHDQILTVLHIAEESKSLHCHHAGLDDSLTLRIFLFFALVYPYSLHHQLSSDGS